MNTRDRFWAAMRREPCDRLPMVEWAPWWKDATIVRWHGEGLPAELREDIPLRAHFGLDDWRQCWLRAISPDAPEPASHGAPLIESAADLERFQQHLWPDPEPWLDDVRQWADLHRRGQCVVWVTLEGFFWLPRRLFGIENHLYAFYDHPGLMKEINAQLTEFHIDCLKAVGEILRPDFVTFAEDMSYNLGPMLSQQTYLEFVDPYYRELIPHIKDMGAVPIIDTDGQVEPMIDWLSASGINGVLPLERQAGVDVAEIRRRLPEFKMIGAYDKMVMNKGEGAIRGEFERLLPTMRSGGFIPSCDHQTPPGVSLQDYHIYVRLLREYAERAVETW